MNFRNFSRVRLHIDIYPFWIDQAILEVELSDEQDKFEIPEFLTVIREVTEDPSFKNYNLAK